MLPEKKNSPKNKQLLLSGLSSRTLKNVSQIYKKTNKKKEMMPF